jgi:hypothetical protein
MYNLSFEGFWFLNVATHNRFTKVLQEDGLQSGHFVTDFERWFCSPSRIGCSLLALHGFFISKSSIPMVFYATFWDSTTVRARGGPNPAFGPSTVWIPGIEGNSDFGPKNLVTFWWFLWRLWISGVPESQVSLRSRFQCGEWCTVRVGGSGFWWIIADLIVTWSVVSNVFCFTYLGECSQSYKK